MANYGRQGSNLAQFMREQLNTVQPNEPEEDIRFDDLDVFTNTEFYDFDTHMRTDFKPADSPPSSKSEPTSATSTIMGGEFGALDLINPGRFLVFFCLRLLRLLCIVPCLCEVSFGDRFFLSVFLYHPWKVQIAGYYPHCNDRLNVFRAPVLFGLLHRGFGRRQ